MNVFVSSGHLMEWGHERSGRYDYGPKSNEVVECRWKKNQGLVKHILGLTVEPMH